MIYFMGAIMCLLAYLLARALNELDETKRQAFEIMNHFIHHLVKDGHVTEEQVKDILEGKRCNHEDT